MCSLRSWPTQNARPVPVSTTQRAAGSSATARTTSSRASLVATSRLFIASGRLRVMVATPSVTSRSTGESVMGGSLPLRLSRRRGSGRRTGRRPGLSRVASPAKGRRRRDRASRPGAARRAGPGRRRGTCATRARGGSGPRTPPRRGRRGRRCGSRSGRRRSPSQCVVRRPQRVEVPRAVGGGSNASARAVRAVAPALLEHRRQLAAREGADPDVVGELGVADEGEVGPQPDARGAGGRGVDEREVPGAVPAWSVRR